jgi:hypothetical protein
MRAASVLQRCLPTSFGPMHALRRVALLLAVDALLSWVRLVLIDLARSWPGAEFVRAPLKRLDRLLGNPRVHGERERIYGGMVRWLIRNERPVILIDWCRLKSDGRHHLLRAAVPVGGRSLTLLDMVFSQREQGSPRAEKRFLMRLKALLPTGVRPIIVADAGFRGPWCRTVEALGWHWVVRLRHRTHVRPATAPDAPVHWVACKSLHAIASARPRNLGAFVLVRSNPLTGRLVVYNKPAQNRHHLRQDGKRRRSKASESSARREREPWLLAYSTDLELTAQQVVLLYARRMQIELSFRDLKSHRYGQAFEDSLTRSAARIEVLLLLHALAVFAAWLTGLAVESEGGELRLTPYRTSRRLYSTLRIGWEAIRRGWITGTMSRWLKLITGGLPRHVLEQMALET